MRPVARDEVLRIGEYEAIREPFRARVIAEKKDRRLSLGPNMTVLFENHDTVLLQIQEMLRTERITKESSIQHEIETYNQLVPGANELSATILIEFDEREERERMLAALSGIERHIHIEVEGHKHPAVWEPGRILEGRASAVLYLKFALSDESVAGIKGGREAAIAATHPAYAARAAILPQTLRSLAEDFE